MPKYRIHAFPVVRVTVGEVEAGSPTEAIEALAGARPGAFDFCRRFDGENTEYGEEISHYLVDDLSELDEDGTPADGCWILDASHLAQALGHLSEGVPLDGELESVPTVELKTIDGRLQALALPRSAQVAVTDVGAAGATTTTYRHGTHEVVREPGMTGCLALARGWSIVGKLCPDSRLEVVVARRDGESVQQIPWRFASGESGALTLRFTCPSAELGAMADRGVPKDQGHADV